MESNSQNFTSWNMHPVAFEVWTDEREKRRKQMFNKPYKWLQESLRPDLFNTLLLEENKEVKRD